LTKAPTQGALEAAGLWDAKEKKRKRQTRMTPAWW